MLLLIDAYYTATRNNLHFTREFRGRALGHMSMDSELPRKSLTRLIKPVAQPAFEVSMENVVLYARVLLW
ncbi:hypothetical protein CMV_009940 [Castanea mollissima]|uniref:Uncharacterized protein n=1 Tax=Castanea mollissima TaxID=60419 RepID=A0A8J4R8Y2_9ROSI|nr:hypothetical protein CMV_009940 [Castanea mollissima]